MKILHTSDLHVGKNLGGFSMLDDQEYILNVIYRYIRLEKPDALLISGDVYDKQTPSAEAVALFDRFLTSAARICPNIMVISGNHDSPERLSFGSNLMESGGVYIASMPKKVTLNDEYGEVDFFLLPFVKPALVRHMFPDKRLSSHEDAVCAALETLAANSSRRSVLLAHQFFAAHGAETELSDSEMVGGAEKVDIAYLVPYSFDYIALGHIHGPQRIGRDCVRYAGSPLKYSFSECRHIKSATLITLREKNNADIRLLPLAPLRDMRKIRGPMSELISPHLVSAANPNDYLHVTLTDETEIVDAIGKLRAVYPNIMQLVYDNKRTQAGNIIQETKIETKSEPELFSEFYELQNNVPMTKEQKSIICELLSQY